MSEPIKYTLSSGKEIEIFPVSMYTLQLATKNLPRPKAPTQIIDGVEQENPAHPDYGDMLVEWEADKRNATVDAIYACGINDDIFDDAARAQVATFRERAKRRNWETPDADDWIVYIKHVLLETPEDFFNVQSLITKGTLPTEAGISEAADDLKSSVEG